MGGVLTPSSTVLWAPCVSSGPHLANLVFFPFLGPHADLGSPQARARWPPLLHVELASPRRMDLIGICFAGRPCAAWSHELNGLLHLPLETKTHTCESRPQHLRCSPTARRRCLQTPHASRATPSSPRPTGSQAGPTLKQGRRTTRDGV